MTGNALALMEHSQLMTVRRQLEALPRKAVLSRPWLGVAAAWVLAFSSRLEAAASLLDTAERGLLAQDRRDDAGQMVGHVAAIRAQIASVRGEFERAKVLAREALNHLPPHDLMTRSWALGALALNHYRTGDLAAADKALAAAVATCQGTGDSHIAVLTLCTLGILQREQGKLHSAADSFREALGLAEGYALRVGKSLPVSAYAHLSLSTVLHEWNDLEAALNHAQTAIQICQQWGEPELLSAAHMRLASILDTVGDTNGAQEAIQKGLRVARDLSPWYTARIALQEALLRLRGGDLGPAVRWMTNRTDQPRTDSSIFEIWSILFIRFWITLGQNRHDDGLAIANRLVDEAATVGAGRYLVGSTALQALALSARGDDQAALAAIQRALTLAEPENYVRTFVDEGEPMGHLLRQAVAQGIAVTYARSLLEALEKEMDRPGGAVSASMVEPLSRRELEILRLLTTHLASTDIARELTVSPNTVRTHIKNIYSKLNVHSRSEAVQKARELDLM